MAVAGRRKLVPPGRLIEAWPDLYVAGQAWVGDETRALLDGAGWIERWALDRESHIGTLRIGASTTIGNYLLPAILAGFRSSLSAAARQNWQV